MKALDGKLFFPEVSFVGNMEEKLKTPFPGSIVYVPETESTMDLAREMIGNPEKYPAGYKNHPTDLESGSVIRAGMQTSGRGRIAGRKWESGRDENLLFTLIIRREEITIPLSAFPLAAGLAVAETLEDYNLKPAIKWPNDILCEEKKICGILCETAGSYLLAGIGLNCNQESFPETGRRNPTSLKLLTGREFSIPEVLEDFLVRIYPILTGVHWRTEVEKRLFAMDRTVVICEGVPENGRRSNVVIRGIGDKGELRTVDSRGRMKEIFSGEILYGLS